MSEKTPIRVFVCHLFEKHADYLRVFEYLESRENFSYLNVSDPERVPGGGREGMKEELRTQIKASEVVVLPITVYDRNPDLVMFQLDCAGAFNKPVVAVKAFGETVVLQRSVMERASDLVDWNARSLVDAIRHHARHENTAQWDVVEFRLD